MRTHSSRGVCVDTSENMHDYKFTCMHSSVAMHATQDCEFAASQSLLEKGASMIGFKSMLPPDEEVVMAITRKDFPMLARSWRRKSPILVMGLQTAPLPWRRRVGDFLCG